MSVKDDAIAALHGALTAVEGEAAKVSADLAAAKSTVDTLGRAATQTAALKDALALAHATLTGAATAAPMVATAWTDIKATVSTMAPWAAGAGGVGAIAYAHFVLKWF